MAVTVAEPDPRWAELGAQACLVLGPLFVTVEHVGSTATPGLGARPVIDLLASTPDLGLVDDGALQTLGYRMVRSDNPEQLLYRREDYDSTAYRLRVVSGP